MSKNAREWHEISDWDEVDEHELKLIAGHLIEIGLAELGVTLGEFVEFLKDMEDRDN